MEVAVVAEREDLDLVAEDGEIDGGIAEICPGNCAGRARGRDRLRREERGRSGGQYDQDLVVRVRRRGQPRSAVAFEVARREEGGDLSDLVVVSREGPIRLLREHRRDSGARCDGERHEVVASVSVEVGREQRVAVRDERVLDGPLRPSPLPRTIAT